MITSAEIKLIKSLNRKRNRYDLGLFVVEGEKSVSELMGSEYIIQKVWDTRLEPDHSDYISKKNMERATHLVNASSVLALVKIPKKAETKILYNKSSLLLDNIKDPGNFGTLIRSAAWFGVTQIICSEETADVYNQKVIMATMGAIFKVNVHYTDLSSFISKTDLPLIGALLEGERLDVSAKNQCHLVIGNESNGISESIRPNITHPVKIQGGNGIESLNASVAGGILLYELFGKN